MVYEPYVVLYDFSLLCLIIKRGEGLVFFSLPISVRRCRRYRMGWVIREDAPALLGRSDLLESRLMVLDPIWGGGDVLLDISVMSV